MKEIFCGFCEVFVSGGYYMLPDENPCCPDCYDKHLKGTVKPDATISLILHQLRLKKSFKWWGGMK